MPTNDIPSTSKSGDKSMTDDRAQEAAIENDIYQQARGNHEAMIAYAILRVVAAINSVADQLSDIEYEITRWNDREEDVR